MNDTDKFMQEELMPFYKRTFDAFKQNHHAIYSVINSFLSGKKSQIGMRITANESVLGEYTLHLDGANVSHLDNGILASEVYTPFGIIRPYVIIEKSTVEKMIQDEPNFIKDPFTTKMKYYRDMTIKFL
jgi:hypothetical protein